MCGILVPQLGIKPEPPALEAWSLNHWITREVTAFSSWPLLTLKQTFYLFSLEANYFTILRWFLPYIDMSQPWVYMCSPFWTPFPSPSPSHPSGSSQCTSPENPVSCIEPRLAICFTYDNICFSAILSPSPTESKRLFYTSVSLLLSCIQGFCYHLYFSNFPIAIPIISGWYKSYLWPYLAIQFLSPH